MGRVRRCYCKFPTCVEPLVDAQLASCSVNFRGLTQAPWSEVVLSAGLCSSHGGSRADPSRADPLLRLSVRSSAVHPSGVRLDPSAPMLASLLSGKDPHDYTGLESKTASIPGSTEP